MATRINADLKKTAAMLEKTFSGCFDIVERPLEDINRRRMLVVFADGLADKEQIHETVIAPLLGFSLSVDAGQLRNLCDIRERLLTSVDLSAEQDYDEAVLKVLSGDTAVFIHGAKEALIIQTRCWENRGIQEAKTQESIRGPKESFTETLLFNIALLRRKLKTPALKTEVFRIGSVSRTDVCLAYLEGIARPELVERIRGRLQAIDVKYLLESGHIEQLIEDSPHSIFATTGNHEKPDAAAAKLLKGRVCILVDGTPFVLTAPMLMGENFTTTEDYYARPFYSNFLRILRFFAYMITLLLPGLYTALVTFHRELIPDQLLSTLINASEGAPMSIGGELFLLLILYEFLREAILRLPQAVGSAIGIVGVLIIGDAAVGINLIGAPTVVIAALSFISSSMLPSVLDSSALLRLGFLLLGTFFGAYGVFAGVFVLLVHLCSLTSYGCPFMLPLSPIRLSGLRDTVLRLDIRRILKRTGY